jgi:hypothetical protein
MSALMAEIGKTAEARALSLRAMDLRELDEPNDACWYVFGRIAEQFGLSEVALEDYARIVRPADLLRCQARDGGKRAGIAIRY